MKIRKTRDALKKAQAAQRSAEAAYRNVADRFSLAVETLGHSKTAYKTARRNLKFAKREVERSRNSYDSAKEARQKSLTLVEKLTRKLKRAGKRLLTGKPAKLKKMTTDPNAHLRIRPARRKPARKTTSAPGI